MSTDSPNHHPDPARHPLAVLGGADVMSGDQATAAEPASSRDGMGPTDLSVAIITCNNATTIRRTLASVHGLAREIVVVDSGSTDETLEIASGEFGARVIRQPWLGHIRQKQLALEACTGGWVLSIDSDESLEPELARALRQAIGDADRDPGRSPDSADAADAAVCGYEVNRRLFMAGRWLRHAFQPEWRLRIVRRGLGQWGGYDPHDQLTLRRGRSVRLPGVLRHDAFPTIAEMVRKQTAHGLRAGESYHAMGRRGSIGQLLISPPAAVIKQLIIRQGWRDGWPGVAASVGAGLSATVKHLALLELTEAPEQAERSAVPPTIPDR